MSTDDPSRYAPPLELRIPLSTIVDPSDGPAVAANPFIGEPPLPSAMTTSPGIATGAATPLAAPTLPDLTDPTQVALLLSRLFGDHLTGASIVPHPNFGQTASGIGVPGQAATPGFAATPVVHPSTLGGDSLPGLPTSSTETFATSLAPGQVEVPTSTGLPPSPTMGGGAPSLASGGSSMPASGTMSGGSADPTSAASAVAPSDASSPFSIAPSFGSAFAPPGSNAPNSASSGSRAVPRASNGASTGSTTAGSLAPSASPTTPPQGTAPDASYPVASHGATSHPTNAGTHGAPPASAGSHVGPRSTYPASSHATAHPAANPMTSADYRHGGADNGGFASYGAPPDLDAFLAIEPTSQGLPRFELISPISNTGASDRLGSAMGAGSPAMDAGAGTPADVSAHGVHADLQHWQGLPTSPTGDHAVPRSLSDAELSPQVPSSGRGPSSPIGSPEVPSSGIVPSSSPFGAPIDLGGMISHPMHAMSVPTITEPSTTPYHVAGGDESRMLRELGRQAFDPYSVRKDFPILDEKVHGGKRLVWLDNAATTQKPRQVIERISYFYEHENSNVHRAAHTLAARSTDAFERARESARRFVNAPSAKEIVWVRGATEGINLIAKTWGRKFVGKGDEIVVTHLEHHANIVPWQMLCAEVGAKLRVAPVDDRGDVILEKYERLMGPRTKLVSIPHVSNALGTITPAKQMVEIAHRYGAHVMVDGAQAVSHMKVDVQDLGCEWYVFSGHKVFAPTGIGVVWGKADVLEASPPWQGGGNMIEDVTFEHTKYQPPPWRFEAGTGSIGDAVGLGAAIEYVERIGMDVIDRYEHELLVYGTQRLATVPGLRMIGTSQHKAGVLSFVLDGQRTEDISAILDKDGIAVRSGHHCAQPILRRYGLEATVRASLAFYNVCEDIDALVESLHRLQAGRA